MFIKYLVDSPGDILRLAITRLIDCFTPGSHPFDDVLWLYLTLKILLTMLRIFSLNLIISQDR